MPRLRSSARGSIRRVDFGDARAGAPQRERCASLHERLAEARARIAHAVHALTRLGAQRAERRRPRDSRADA